MKVVTTPTTTFVTGDALTPPDLNAAYQYAHTAFLDVVSKRYTYSMLVLPFVESTAVGYVDTDSLEKRSFRFVCPRTCIAERAFLNANLVSNGTVQVTILDTGAGVPSGATVPWLTTGPDPVTDATVDTTDINQERVLLVAGTTYVISLVGAVVGVTFTTSRFDVVLHLRTDRWQPGASSTLPSYSPVGLTELDSPNANNVNASETAFNAATALLASSLSSPACVFFTAVNFDNGSTPTRFLVPRFDSARARSVVVRMYLLVLTDAGGVSSATTMVLSSAAGATLASCSTGPVGPSSAGSGSTAAISVAVATAVVGVSADPTADLYVSFTASAATPDIRKAYGYVWFDRA